MSLLAQPEVEHVNIVVCLYSRIGHFTLSVLTLQLVRVYAINMQHNSPLNHHIKKLDSQLVFSAGKYL